MGYIPDEQRLEPSITIIVNGIEQFETASNARIHDNDWKQEHLDELSELQKEMIDLKHRLVKLRKETR